MKPANPTPKFWLSMTTVLALSGCVAVQTPPTPNAPPQPTAKQPRIVHTVIPTEQNSSCGSLHDFVIDVQQLESRNRKALLDELSRYEGTQFSCDRLKTGLLLSQIGKTVSEDSLAIEILQQYENTDKLDQENKQLVQLLLFQSKERKRLHILLGKLGQKLVAQKSLSKTMSENLLTLQQKMNQLQKLETDINETEQSIATPSTSSLDTETEENSGS